MFSRDHLIIGAVGFVLGGVVATTSITAVLMTQTHEEKVCPPITAIVAPTPTTMNQGQPTTPTETPAPAPAPAPAAIKAAPEVVKPVPTKKLSSLEAEEADRLTEEQKQLLKRKQNLDSQVNDSAEIIRLKEQQIKEMEAKLKE